LCWQLKGKEMKRFFFSLRGGHNVDDRLGLRFDTELQALRAAQRLAGELSEARPALEGNTWIALTQNGSENEYYVSIDGREWRWDIMQKPCLP
jgi:hypothetical protein